MSKFGDESDTYSGVFKAETAHAWLLSDDDGSGVPSDMPDVWLPKSQCEMITPNARVGDAVEIEVPNWLADEKGLLG